MSQVIHISRLVQYQSPRIHYNTEINYSLAAIINIINYTCASLTATLKMGKESCQITAIYLLFFYAWELTENKNLYLKVFCTTFLYCLFLGVFIVYLIFIWISKNPPDAKQFPLNYTELHLCVLFRHFVYIHQSENLIKTYSINVYCSSGI